MNRDKEWNCFNETHVRLGMYFMSLFRPQSFLSQAFHPQWLCVCLSILVFTSRVLLVIRSLTQLLKQKQEDLETSVYNLSLSSYLVMTDDKEKDVVQKENISWLIIVLSLITVIVITMQILPAYFTMCVSVIHSRRLSSLLILPSCSPFVSLVHCILNRTLESSVDDDDVLPSGSSSRLKFYCTHSFSKRRRNRKPFTNELYSDEVYCLFGRFDAYEAWLWPSLMVLRLTWPGESDHKENIEWRVRYTWEICSLSFELQENEQKHCNNQTRMLRWKSSLLWQ